MGVIRTCSRSRSSRADTRQKIPTVGASRTGRAGAHCGQQPVSSGSRRSKDAIMIITRGSRAAWDGTEPPVSAEEAMAVLAVLDAAWVSAEAGREVKLDSRN